MLMASKWSFPVAGVRVIDGDTMDLTLDLGFKVFIRRPCRLAAVNTAEVRGGSEATRDLARQATEFVRQFVGGATAMVWLPTAWPDRYRGDLLADGASLSQALIDNRLGLAYEGGSRGGHPALFEKLYAARSQGGSK